MGGEKGYAGKLGFQRHGRALITECFLEQEKQTLGLHIEPTGQVTPLLNSLP